LRHPQQHNESAIDLADDLAINNDLGLTDSLDNGTHRRDLTGKRLPRISHESRS